MQHRVVVLDDDADLGRVVCDAFQLVGADSCRYYTSLAEMQRNDSLCETDVAVLDINLGPGVPNGLDALDWLERSAFRGRVYFLTGHAVNHPLVTKAAQRKSAAVLQKPINLSDLAAILRGHDDPHS